MIILNIDGKGGKLIFQRGFKNNGYDNAWESVNYFYKYEVTAVTTELSGWYINHDYKLLMGKVANLYFFSIIAESGII